MPLEDEEMQDRKYVLALRLGNFFDRTRITKQEFARSADISPSMVRAVLNAKTNCSIEILYKISMETGISCDVLLGIVNE